jgi:hypothetical protein
VAGDDPPRYRLTCPWRQVETNPDRPATGPGSGPRLPAA